MAGSPMQVQVAQPQYAPLMRDFSKNKDDCLEWQQITPFNSQSGSKKYPFDSKFFPNEKVDLAGG